MADVYSYTNKPPELFTCRKSSGREREEADVVAREGFLGLSVDRRADRPGPGARWRHGPAHFYKPANYKNGGPAVVFVHGAGYAQNVA